MSRFGDTSSEARFASFLTALAGVIGHADRAGPLRAYYTGLLMPAERKSVEPMAAVTAPSRVAAQHQSLLRVIGQSTCSDDAVLAKVRELTLPAIDDPGLDRSAALGRSQPSSAVWSVQVRPQSDQVSCEAGCCSDILRLFEQLHRE